MATTSNDQNLGEATLETKQEILGELHPSTESEEQKEAKEKEAEEKAYRYVFTYPPNAPGCWGGY